MTTPLPLPLSAQLIAHELAHGIGSLLSGGAPAFALGADDEFAWCMPDAPFKDMRPEQVLATLVAGPLTSAILDGWRHEGTTATEVLHTFSNHESSRAGGDAQSDLVLASGALPLIGKRNLPVIREALGIGLYAARIVATYCQQRPRSLQAIADIIEGDQSLHFDGVSTLEAILTGKGLTVKICILV